MDTPKNELRQRLREMLTIPERERTDAQWDEIIELEIRLAPGNQIDPNRANEPVGAGPGFRPPRQNKPHQGGQQRNKGRRPNKGGNPQRSGGQGNGNGNGGGNPPPSAQ